ncbi:hypothetical protein A8F21_38780 [Burkholderia cenocepacia]|nr:hypothetical protein A8F21_38780 [Burkholderia cenocepacia]
MFFQNAIDFLPILLKGAVVTIEITACAFVLVCSVLTSTVKSGGSQTRPCSLPRAWVLEPVTEYKTHGCRAGLPEARTVTRAIYIECACTSMGSEDHVCSFCRNGRH